MFKTKNPKIGSSRRTKHFGKRTSERNLAIKERRTQRPLHKRLFLHPANVMFLLCVGVLLVDLTTAVAAGSITITGTVNAPPLVQGAIITRPTDGDTLATSPVEVDGTCPTNSYVILVRNGETGGVAWCTNNTFTVETGLYPGTNVLQAQDYNITDNAGPSTPSITVNYVPPTSPATTIPATSGSSSNPNAVSPLNSVSSAVPLLLTTNFSFSAVTIDSRFSTTISLDGGTPPYRVTINWGDGNTQQMTFNSDPAFVISHVYTKHGYFPITLAAVDSNGSEQYLQAAAFIRLPAATSFLTGPNSKVAKPNIISRIATNSKDWLLVIWPSYFVVILMVFCFWLGEKEIYLKVANRFKRRRRVLRPHWL